MMKNVFKLFKQRNTRAGTIASQFTDAISRNDKGTQINIYVDEQILFQITHGITFTSEGLSLENSNDFVELHFFNKNKTHTIENQPIIKELTQKEGFIYYEKPKDYHFYFRAIGRDAIEIEELIWFRINTVYSNIETSRISYEVAIY
jgi:hypothetical protein